MSKSIVPGFDDYDFETLIHPIFWVVFPIALSVSTLGFNINKALGVTVLGVQVVLIPVLAIKASIRERGRAVEKDIFSVGVPTLKLLRTREGQNDHIKKTRRELIATLSNKQLLSLKAEANDPIDADQRIELALNDVREMMRDEKQFFLLRRENKSYGFWRNMYSIKNYGQLCSIVALLISIGSFFISSPLTKTHVLVSSGSALFSIIVFLYWSYGVNKNHILNSANRYAEQFFKSAMTLASNSKKRGR